MTTVNSDTTPIGPKRADFFGWYMMRAIDLFAGLGGNSEGAKQAGVSVLWATNHLQSAIETHAANYPDAHHVCQDLLQANCERVPEHDLLMASPSCEGHSRARVQAMWAKIMAQWLKKGKDRQRFTFHDQACLRSQESGKSAGT